MSKRNEEIGWQMGLAEIEELITFPIKFDEEDLTLYDADNKPIFEMRTWADFTYTEKGQDCIVHIGRMLVDRMNRQANYLPHLNWEGHVVYKQG